MFFYVVCSLMLGHIMGIFYTFGNNSRTAIFLYKLFLAFVQCVLYMWT